MIYSAPWELIPPPRLDREQADKTKGMWAYRYNGHFFRSYVPGLADIYHTGRYLAGRIPRDDEKREEWIKQIIALIGNELLWRAERGIPVSEPVLPDFDGTRPISRTSVLDIALDHPVDDRNQIAFMDILPDYDLGWLRPFTVVDWTYVIDLEDHAFTVNGILHFSFDRMPQDISECLVHPSTNSACYTMTPHAEIFHSTFVQRWPPSLRTPPEELIVSYNLISPIMTNLEDWHIRTWEELNAAESLSIYLVATILRDQTTQIRNPDMLDERRMFAYCQWQLITAAAPAAVHLLPSLILDYSRGFNPHIEIGLGPENTNSWWYVGRAGDGDWKPPPPMWFRGCLIGLCHRLDTAEFAKAEIYRMIQTLKTSHCNEAIGLLFDGRNVVGVALSSTHVRHSPVLPMYNHQLRLMDGFRLMMHLLSPCILTEKVPWHSSSSPTRSTLSLPMEIVLRIIQLVDRDTYSVLSRVSYTFCALYFTYPRLGNFILLQPTQGGAFHAFDTAYQQRCRVYLNRCMTNPYCSGFRFYHRQPKLGPTFFTPQEYEAAQREFMSTATYLRNPRVQHIWSKIITNTVHLGLRVLDEYVPCFDEPLIPKDFEVSMQVALGAWTMEVMDDTEDIEAHPAISAGFDYGSYCEPISPDDLVQNR